MEQDSHTSRDAKSKDSKTKDARTAGKKERPNIFERWALGRRANLSEEEIKDLVADNEGLQENEKRMIHEILDMGDMTVREVMQPRVDMILVADDETVITALERMHGTGYSRLPVYHDDVDDIVGIVTYKDLLEPILEERRDDVVSKYMFDPMFIPETKDILPLLSEMQQNHQQMAIVVDEYGGIDGLVTIEDIMEEIVGEIIDESDLEGSIIKQLDDRRWRVDGRFPIEEARKLGWPVEESDDYETIAGWLLGTFESVPKAGDEFVKDGYGFKIERMRRNRISYIRVKRFDEIADQD